jgi:hypothetical protein
MGHNGQFGRVVQVFYIFPGHWGLFLCFSTPDNGLADIARGTGTVVGEIFFTFLQEEC